MTQQAATAPAAEPPPQALPRLCIEIEGFWYELRIDPKPGPFRRFQVVKSDNGPNPGQSYWTGTNFNGMKFCTCTGQRFHNQPGGCKHIQALAAAGLI